MKPCIKCGGMERYASGECKACARVRADNWSAAHPESMKAYRDKWNSKNATKVKASSAKRYLDNRDKELAAAAKRYAANPEKVKAAAAKRYRDHPAQAKVARAAWHAANRDNANARSKTYYAENKHKDKERRAKWMADNQATVKVSRKKWAEAHPESRRIRNLNRRARVHGSGGRLSSGLAARLFKLQRGKCPCCGLPLGDDFHLDHRMPLARGGAHEDSNMQLLRKGCNHKKHAKDPIQFMQERGFLL